MKKNKAGKGVMKCLQMEREGEIINSLDTEGFTEKVVSDHRPGSVELMVQAVETAQFLCDLKAYQ